MPKQAKVRLFGKGTESAYAKGEVNSPYLWIQVFLQRKKTKRNTQAVFFYYPPCNNRSQSRLAWRLFFNHHQVFGMCSRPVRGGSAATNGDVCQGMFPHATLIAEE